MYFDKLVSHLRLVTTDIDVTGSKSSCPNNVVNYAIDLYEKSKGTKNEYDKVFCVIDKDTHTHYDTALMNISNYPGNVLFGMNTVPCFELWLLFHYVYTTKPFSKIGKKSICTALIKNDLKTYLPNYKKNISNLNEDELKYIFNSKTIDKAIERSLQLVDYNKTALTDNPSTKIHELVSTLQELKKRPFIK